MSLDIWLGKNHAWVSHYGDDDGPEREFREEKAYCSTCGTNKHCGDCGQVRRNTCTLGSLNITHNVSDMWRYLGVYDALYMSNGKLVSETLDKLRAGLAIMNTPEGFAACEKMNPPNGWGNATVAKEFLTQWVKTCEENPEAKIGVWK